MIRLRQRKSLFALLAFLLLFTACKGESPTAPPPGGGSPGGGTTPPSGATITLTVSNASPLINSTSLITATVTQNSAAVPNGTAVEFRTNLGTFTDTNSDVTIRTTTNGVATATLTSGTAGTATVTATVNNASRTTNITFQAEPAGPPPPPDTSAAITAVAPTLLRPAGGEIVTITGRNFRDPVRVLFDFGTGTQPVEGTVLNPTSSTQIQVLTPRVDLGSGQSKTATLIVIVGAGSPSEQRLTSSTSLTFQNEKLTPIISAVSPASGPIGGGTRITIIGEGFQAPTQVFFGAQEAQILNVTFSQIIVLSPTARDTSSDGSGAVTGPVDIMVKNIASNTSATLPNGFRYTPKMQITAAGPTQGSSDGGTRVQIDGTGFDDPVAVVIGGVAAQPIRVSGTQIIAITSPVLLTSCSNVTGPITVTNIENGDTASGPTFTYIVPKPVIVGISPNPVLAGSSVNITVANAKGGLTKITLADKTAFVTATTRNPDGTTTYTATVPTTFTFTTAPCTTGSVTGTQLQPLTVSVTYLDVASTCTDTAPNSLVILPPGSTGTPPAAPCVLPPPPSGTASSVGSCGGAGASCAAGTAASATGTATSTATITVTNTAASGSQSLTVTPTATAGSNLTTVSISPANATIAPGSSQAFVVTMDPAAAGAFCANVTWASNSSTAIPASCASGTATP